MIRTRLACPEPDPPRAVLNARLALALRVLVARRAAALDAYRRTWSAR